MNRGVLQIGEGEAEFEEIGEFIIDTGRRGKRIVVEVLRPGGQWRGLLVHCDGESVASADRQAIESKTGSFFPYSTTAGGDGLFKKLEALSQCLPRRRGAASGLRKLFGGGMRRSDPGDCEMDLCYDHGGR